MNTAARPIHRLANLTIAALAIDALASLSKTGALWAGYMDGLADLSLAIRDPLGPRGLALAYVVLKMATGIVFIAWFARAFHNAVALGLRREGVGPVGVWFLPILNLFGPYLMMRDVWSRSFTDPATDTPTTGLGWVRAWWAAWTGVFVVPLVASAWTDPFDHVTRAILDGPLRAIAAVCAIVMVHRLSRRQTRRVAGVGTF
ncbi:MAG: DUF4328 domain-containing protein [Sandaracinaceae bacterium]